jgi:hopanoid biosynthesis associated protein HpnK
VRRIIINADDFGLTSGVNRAIFEAHLRGVVTSSTLMACGAQFEEAVRLTSELPGLSVGCHVVLVDGSPTLNPSQVACLLPPQAQTFRHGLTGFACRAIARQLDEEQIEAEITAQIRKLQSRGIKVSHLDSHKHTHMFPVVFRAMIRAAKQCGVCALRNPFEPLLFFSAGSWKRQFQLGILRSFRASFRHQLKSAGLMTPDGCIGIAATGALNLETFRALIEGLPEGTWEFVCHPGYNDGELDVIKTRLKASREFELTVLTSPEVKELLHREQIDVISYRDFASLAGATPKVARPLTAKST